MLTDLATLVEFNTWAARRQAAALAPLRGPAAEPAARGADPAEAVQLLAHVVAAERIYFLRLQDLDPWPQDFWPSWDLDRTRQEIEESSREWRHGIAREDFDPDRRVTYRNTQGTVYSSSVRSLATHVFLHGMHHRGQIAQWLARAGTPTAVDYIVFERERGMTETLASADAGVAGVAGGRA